MPIEIQDNLNFFPEFKKLDFFQPYQVESINFGTKVTYVVCRHKETNTHHLFGWGSNQFGQLANKNLTMMTLDKPLDLTSEFVKEPDEIIT